MQTMADVTWDNYIEEGADYRHRNRCKRFLKPKSILFSFCVGGTILSTALAVLAARDVHPQPV